MVLHARPGDEVLIKGHRIGEHDRCGEVVEARGIDGTSPFVVRWDDTGHTTILYAGTDCEIHRPEQRRTHRGGEQS